MTTKCMKLATILCLTLCWATGAFAQTTAKTLSLEQAVRIGVEHNLSLRAARQDLETSKWGLRQAYSNWLPKVEIASGYTRLDDETVRRANVFVDMGRQMGIDPSDLKPAAYRESYSTNVTVIQPIYNGGAEWSGIRMARAARKISRYALQDTEQETTLRIKRAYFNALKAQEMVALAKEATASTEQHLTQVRRKLEVGSGNRADVLRWEVQLAQDQGNVVEAENGLAISKAALNEAMGLALEEAYRLVPVSMDEIEENVSDDPVAPSVAAHPGVRTMQASVEFQQASVRMAQSGFQPKVNMAYNRSWEQDDDIQLDGDKTWSVSVQVSLPIFNSFGDYSGVRKAKAEKRKTEMTAKRVEKGILLQATSASLNLKAAKTRIRIARKGVEQAEENLRMVQNMYDVGTLSNMDLIDTQLARNGARANLINAVYDYYIAEAELERALGR
ncbi:MAG: TolC family protein [Candidatus Latescibacteria bacterium]|nr:TolC family protein [Candidatus Latescibacterota bacterium]